MSHAQERQEKTCLNCGTTPLIDTYCHHCGQENVEPKQSVWHLVTHVFNDITHFDGKFFSSMKLLLFRPGFLSAEYFKGRRKKYLDPIRMYLFISAAFFLLLYSVLEPIEKVYTKDKEEMLYIDSLREMEKDVDGFQFTIIENERLTKKVSIFTVRKDQRFGERHYDSLQQSLPYDKRDNFLERYWRRRIAGIYQTYDANPYNFVPNTWDIFMKSWSKFFFISLPLFAFYLYLLNIRRRKQWYYVSHAIFSLHYYCVSFIFLAIIVATYKIDLIGNAVWRYTAAALILGLFAYLYFAMLRYYGQHWAKTLAKFLVLCVITFITYTLLVIAMFMAALASAH